MVILPEALEVFQIYTMEILYSVSFNMESAEARRSYVALGLVAKPYCAWLWTKRTLSSNIAWIMPCSLIIIPIVPALLYCGNLYA